MLSLCMCLWSVWDLLYLCIYTIYLYVYVYILCTQSEEISALRTCSKAIRSLSIFNKSCCICCVCECIYMFLLKLLCSLCGTFAYVVLFHLFHVCSVKHCSYVHIYLYSIDDDGMVCGFVIYLITYVRHHLVFVCICWCARFSGVVIVIGCFGFSFYYVL